MRILMTGSEGSLARMVIPEFQRLGHAVLGMDNFARHGVVERPRTYDFRMGNLTDSTVVREVFHTDTIDIEVSQTRGLS